MAPFRCLTRPTRPSARRRRCFLAPAAGGAERQLTASASARQGNGVERRRNEPGLHRRFCLSQERRYGADQVWTVTVDGAARRLTTDADHDHTGSRFSPDGQWVLATHQLSTDAVIARKLNHGGPTDLVVIPAGGGPERVLTADWDYLPSGERWSPDGRYVYFTSGVGGTIHLFRVTVNGGAVEQVTRGERRIGGLSFDRAMTRMAFTVGRIEGPPEIHVANIDGSNDAP